MEVTRDGKIHAMSFERGETKQKLHVIAEVKGKKHTGTLITFKPDPEIFQETTEYKSERIIARLNDLAGEHGSEFQPREAKTQVRKKQNCR